MTASHAQAIASAGKGLDTYVRELLVEIHSTADKEVYTNEHTERGNELEEVARSLYELETGHIVETVGFVEYNEYSGCSPDGLVGDDGLVEFKCPADKKYLDLLLDEKIDTGYVWQVQMQMLVTGRTWCDLVFFNPNFERSMYIKRIEADPAAHAKIIAGLQAGKKLMDEYEKKIKK